MRSFSASRLHSSESCRRSVVSWSLRRATTSANCLEGQSECRFKWESIRVERRKERVVINKHTMIRFVSKYSLECRSNCTQRRIQFAIDRDPFIHSSLLVPSYHDLKLDRGRQIFRQQSNHALHVLLRLHHHARRIPHRSFLCSCASLPSFV